jgi:predicted porin
MISGGAQASRWGLKGTEDLGGGLSTLFDLENGFDSTNGRLTNGEREFGKQAYVGLSGSGWGTVTVGRLYDPLVDLVFPVQPDYYLVLASPGDVDNADASARFNSAVKWASPNWSGLRLSVMYSFGGVAGSVASGHSYAAAASYNNGPLTLAAGYLHLDNGNPSLSARGTTSADTFFNSSVNLAYNTARTISVTRAGASYLIGPVTLGRYYSFSQYNPDAASAFAQAENYHNASIYVNWQVSPSLETQIAYDYLKSLGDSSAKYSQASFGADYFLNKRTDVYGYLAYGRASGQNGAGAAQMVLGSWDIDAGKPSQGMIWAGIRHRF